MQREDFIQLLEWHDWHYERSDDHRKYIKGGQQRASIQRALDKSKEEGWGDEAKSIYDQYRTKHYGV